MDHSNCCCFVGGWICRFAGLGIHPLGLVVVGLSDLDQCDLACDSYHVWSMGRDQFANEREMKADAISASAIKTFEQCPLKYHAIYELHLREEEPHPLTVMGTTAHEMLEKAVKHRKKSGTALETHDPMFWRDSAIAANKMQSDLIPLLEELVRNAVRWGYFRNVSRTVGCELDIHFNLMDGTLVRGKIDRLDILGADADIIDVKTQKSQFDDDELNNNWQARIYNIGARLGWRQITGTASVSFWVLRHQVQRIYMTQEHAERDIQVIVDKVAEIRACKDPQPQPTPLCEWCPFKDQCPATKENALERLKRMRSH